MGRLIVLVLVVVLAVWLLRRSLRPGAGGRHVRGGEPSTGSPPRSAELVRCSHCGMYLPEAEARRVAGLAFCSDEHARLGPRKP